MVGVAESPNEPMTASDECCFIVATKLIISSITGKNRLLSVFP